MNGDQADISAPQSGAVYVFERTADSWRQDAYVKASNTDPADWFGYSIALSDGVLAVGAAFESSPTSGLDGEQSDNGSVASGAAYLFHRLAGVWEQQNYVKASNSDAQDSFGTAVALSASAGTLVVSAIGEDSGAPGIGGEQADNSL